MVAYTNFPPGHQVTRFVAIISVDVVNHGAVGVTRTGNQVPIDTSYYVGATQVTPTVGDQWVVQRISGDWRLMHRIAFNDPNQSQVTPTQGQHVVGSGQGPVELQGTVVNVNAPLQLDAVPTSAYPATGSAGMMIYDSTLGEVVVYNGKAWAGLVGSGGATGPVPWSDLTGVPTNFPTVWSDIGGVPTDFPTTWAQIADIPSYVPTAPPASGGTQFWASNNTWQAVQSSGALQIGVTPSGSANGTNTTFTLPQFAAGTTMVYLNGLRQQVGSDYTETNTTTVTFTVAPAAGDVIEADFLTNSVAAQLKVGEVPSGTVNGSNTTFSLSHSFAVNSTSVFRNGLREELNTDYTETAPNEVVFATAPLASDTILVDYLILA